MARNPAWTRDELILALDLYFRVNPLHTSEQNPEIQALSAALNELPVHAVRPDGEHFRNPNGVCRCSAHEGSRTSRRWGAIAEIGRRPRPTPTV